MTAAEKILGKALAGSDLDTEGWSKIQAGLRDRAFFSAKVEEARILHAARQMCAEVADGKRSASEFRRDMRALLSKMGYPEGDGSLKDLYSERRLDVLRETNVRQARGYVQHLEGTTRGALMAFPAQELVRIYDREKPRDWESRWVAAGGTLHGGRMIALKGDPIWTAISRFGTPWPPFDFNSGMGVEDIDFETAVELGVMAEDDPPPEPEEVDFNAGLAAEVEFNDVSREWAGLKRTFGDQIQLEGGKVKWRGEIVRANLMSGGAFNMKLGVATEELVAKLGAANGGASLATDIAGRPLLVDQNWRDAKRSDGGTHLAHFFHNPNEPDDIPLTAGDVELLPSIWRNPDHVRKLQADIFEADVDGLDGSRYVIQVRINPGKNEGNPQLWTYYKTKKPRANSAGPTAFRRTRAATLNAGRHIGGGKKNMP